MSKRRTITETEMIKLAGQGNKSAKFAWNEFDRIKGEGGVPIIYMEGTTVTCEDEGKRYR